MKKQITSLFKLVFLAVFLSIGFSYVFAEPSTPAGNPSSAIISGLSSPNEQAKGGDILSGSRFYVRGNLRVPNLTAEGTASISGNVSVGTTTAAPRDMFVGNSMSIPMRLAVGYNVSGSSLSPAGTATTRGYVQMNNIAGTTLRQLCSNRVGRIVVCP